jgi:uncharacterized phage-associated protein
MAYDSITVANTLLQLAARRVEPIDPMKLQKLVYFAHGWHLAIKGSPLISEAIQAWDFGPVIPSIYHAFKHYGPNPITRQDDRFGRVADPDHLDFLERILELYGVFTSIQLSNMSHDTKGPWHQARANNPGLKCVEIAEDHIRDYFVGIARSKNGRT